MAVPGVEQVPFLSVLFDLIIISGKLSMGYVVCAEKGFPVPIHWGAVAYLCTHMLLFSLVLILELPSYHPCYMHMQ